MSGGSPYDTGAPTLEVLVYRHGRLLTRELCESEEDAASVAERWRDVADVAVVVDDLSSKHGPDDILAPEEPFLADSEEGRPIAEATMPGLGTE
ncbi:hypothetical protein [Nocardioides dilutus]